MSLHRPRCRRRAHRERFVTSSSEEFCIFRVTVVAIDLRVVERACGLVNDSAETVLIWQSSRRRVFSLLVSTARIAREISCTQTWSPPVTCPSSSLTLAIKSTESFPLLHCCQQCVLHGRLRVHILGDHQPLASKFGRFLISTVQQWRHALRHWDLSLSGTTTGAKSIVALLSLCTTNLFIQKQHTLIASQQWNH